jgi:acetylornithine deacetylase/succinyl-diaminopimelate desuccinylase-like protein
MRLKNKLLKRCPHIALAIALTAAPFVAAADNAVSRLSTYVQINTVNPPGNEIESAQFFAKIFEAAGIEYEIAESAPGRGNIWARLPAADPATAEPGIVLLHHMDVVSASAGHWDLPPFSGEIQNGFLYGRGTLDTKGLGIIQLQAFLALAASGQPLIRDVLFMATADEEAGGSFGAGWLIEERAELFENMGFLVNEGGGGRDLGGGKRMVSVEVTQKVPLWLRLTASGRPGHGSAPQPVTAVTRLVRAANRILDAEFPVNIIEPVEIMLSSTAQFRADPEERAAMQDIAAAVKQPGFVEALQAKDPGTHALLRNTCSMTRLSASDKINVVPPEASLELDCRLLPDQSPEAFREQIASIVDDPDIRIETLLSFAPAVSPADTQLFRAIEAVTERHYPGTPVVPGVVGGFTDSHFFREMGIVSYGYAPIFLPVAEIRGVHGNNERISVDVLNKGVVLMTELLQEFTQTP